MEVLHITPNTNGYEKVTLIANRISKTNRFALIERNGIEFMTGGFLLQDTPKIREVLDSIPKPELYEFVRQFKTTPFVKAYQEE